MSQGTLRVFLGAAPGVGKTVTMLEEGKRLASEGQDVVVGLLETHGRAATAAMADGLELIPRQSVRYRGMATGEMDTRAILARGPDIVLVDELAHTNAPGMPNAKRWMDVRDLLDAGVSVMTTVNVQHIESLNDVVEKITGVPQHETVPDEALRAADQIEVVDIAPSALRRRLADGNVYPAERIDAALSNYFRLGNLTALRELALLWLADDVDAALRAYRSEHRIEGMWETRERVVVALSGGPEGEVLLRRGARIAARTSGGELVAVFVNTEDGLRHGKPGTLTVQRALVEQLGGEYHQIVGADIPTALIDFARGIDATQLVIGVSRRSRLQTMLEGQGVGTGIIRKAGGIDVHIVNHTGHRARAVLPRRVGAIPWWRRALGFATLLVFLPLVTWILSGWTDPNGLLGVAVALQLLVVVVAVIGGIWPALFAAVSSGLAIDFFFITPLYTITIAQPSHIIVLLATVVSAVLVSYVVDQAARRGRLAWRAEAESELLSSIAGNVLRGESALQALVTQSREAFGFTGIRLVEGDAVICSAGDIPPGTSRDSLPVGLSGRLEFSGRELSASQRRLLTVIAAQADIALQHSDLQRAADEVSALTETDHVRSALLSAVSHDLRRPLTSATVAVTALSDRDATWSEEDRAELLATAEESLTTLTSLVTNLLDTTRLQAGVLAVSSRPVSVDDVILPALDELGFGPDEVELDLDPGLPPVDADPALLQRVVVNVLSNAANVSPSGCRVRVATSRLGDVVEIRVIDHGPGLSDEAKAGMFVPFQREGDTNNRAGLGLGLAIAKGFTEGMGGLIRADDTPRGGLTMVISLPVTGTPRPVAEADIPEPVTASLSLRKGQQ